MGSPVLRARYAWLPTGTLVAAWLVVAACDASTATKTSGRPTTNSGGTSSGGASGGTTAGGPRGGNPSSGGTAAAGRPGDPSDGGAADGGASGASDGGAADGGTGDGTGQGGSDGGAGGERADLGNLVEHGIARVSTVARPAYGAVLLANDGERIYAVESRRDVEPGPLGLPWRSRFRLAAYDGGVERWAFAAEPDDVVSDVIVHPSGDVTIAILHYPPARMAYELVRLDRDGAPLGATALAEPVTAPLTDYGTGPRPLFRMKSDFADATVGGWVRLIPHGEGLYVTFLSFVDALSTDPLSSRIALGIESLEWRSNAYAERWGRVVEGPHQANPAAWTYDELRWLEQAIRPFFALDDSTGDLLVGRAWNTTRCRANVAVFGEFTTQDCVTAVLATENQRFPLAVTRFDAAGERLGTVVLAPDDDASEQVPFALVAHGGKLAVAGAVVRMLPSGTPRTYPDANGYVDYDGYVAIYDRDARLLLHHDYNQGRGDVLAAMRWTPEGIVAAGASGWDRWQGGMSISRGADPFLAWLAPDGSRAAARVLPMSDGSRHFNLHDVVIAGRAIVAHGYADAPMTHSADGGNVAARTFGALSVRLDAP